MRRIKEIWSFLTKPKVYWRLFSLLLAVIFWLLAVGDGTFRGTERVIALQVALDNLPGELVVVDPPESVKVRITGLSPFLNRSEDLLSASVDLHLAAEGPGAYSVNVEAPAGIEVISVTPRWVNIETEQVLEKLIPVIPAILGLDPGGAPYQAKPSPPLVTVRARRSILERADQAVVYVTAAEDLPKLQGSFPVQVLDASGRSLAGITVDPAEVEIEIGFRQESDQD